MFNSSLLINQSYVVILCAFCTIFIIRYLFVKTKLATFIYHIILFCIVFFIGIAFGGIVNDGYDRLEEFIELEKNHKLNDAKQNLQKYPSMLAIDLECFKNSEEFRDSLKSDENFLNRVEDIIIGWFLVLIFDFAMICMYFMQYLVNKIRNKSSIKHW